jgi:hypothetical protein
VGKHAEGTMEQRRNLYQFYIESRKLTGELHIIDAELDKNDVEFLWQQNKKEK